MQITVEKCNEHEESQITVEKCNEHEESQITVEKCNEHEESQITVEKCNEHKKSQNIEVKIDFGNFDLKGLQAGLNFIKKHPRVVDQCQSQTNVVEKIHSLRFIKIKKCYKGKNAESYYEKDKDRFNEQLSNVLPIVVYIKGIMKAKNDSAIRIENALYEMAVGETVYPVYSRLNDFRYSKYACISIKSSTGSGKTRIIPFILPSMAINENMIRPFIIMTQPSKSIIAQKMTDFNKLIGNEVIFTDKYDELLKHYKMDRPEKPVYALFTPYGLLKFLHIAANEKIDVFSRTRFCLDEVHERPVELDIVIAKLSENIMNFPCQVILMTATPDKSIVKKLGEVKIVNISQSFLYPISVWNHNCKDLKDIINCCLKNTTESLIKMAKREINPGHILAFLPGNRQIKELMSAISSQNNSNFSVLRVNVNPDDTPESFYKRMDIEISKIGLNSLYVLPIQLAGYVPLIQKEIAQRILPPKFNNVVKLIAATNVVESSVTIPDLAVVVDTGVFNYAEYLSGSGITRIDLAPITKSMQEQRKGRVGRVRPGICYQITLNGLLSDSLEPPILREDLSFKMLELRKIGYELENIKNLPDAPSQQKLQESKDSLIRLHALDENGKITSFGDEITKYQGFTPLLSAAIIKLGRSSDNPVFKYVVAVIIQIMSSSNMITNHISDALVKNCCFNSDVVTIAKTIAPLFNFNKRNAEEKCIEYGISIMAFNQIRNVINRVIQNKFTRGKDPHTVMKATWKSVSDFFLKEDILNITDQIIDMISKLDERWIERRLFKLECIYHKDNKKMILMYKKQNMNVSVHPRPGMIIPEAPGSSYIFSLQENTSVKKTFGSIIHYHKNYDKNFKCSSFYFDNQINVKFLVPFIEANAKKLNVFKMFPLDREIEVPYVSSFVETKEGTKQYVSFVATKFDSINILEEAIKKYSKLIPYIGGSLIVPSNNPNCLVEIFFNGTTNYLTNTILPKMEGQPNIYSLDAKMADYLLTHTQELAANNPPLRIAITKGNNDNFVSLPDKIKLTEANRMIIISENNISFKKPIQFEHKFSSESSLKMLQNASLVFPGVMFKKDRNAYFINSTVQIAEELEKLILSCFPKGELSQPVPMHFNSSESKTSFFYIRDWEKHKLEFEELEEKMKEKDKLKDILKNIENETIDDDFLKANNIQLNQGKDPNKDNVIKAINRKICKLEKNSNRYLHLNEKRMMFYEAIKKFTNFTSIYKMKGANAHFIGDEIFITPTKKYNEKFLNQFSLQKKCEKIPVVRANISIPSGINEKKFHDVVECTVNDFGFLITDIQWMKNECIVKFLGCQFAFYFAYALREKLFPQGDISFVLPPDQYPPTLFIDGLPTIDEINNWFNQKHLDQLKLFGTTIIGPRKQILEARKLFASDSAPVTKFKAFKLPAGVAIDTINTNVEAINRTKKVFWNLDIINRLIIAPREDSDEVVQLLERFPGSSNEEVFGCIMGCESPRKSDPKVTIYDAGSSESRPICLSCFKDLLDNATQPIQGQHHIIDHYIKSENEIKLPTIGIEFSKVDPITNQVWPKLPICQYINTLKQIPEAIPYVEGWIDGVVSYAIRSNKHIFTYCPQHPQIILNRPNGEVLKCCVDGCKLCLCNVCNTWHDPNDPEKNCFDWTGKRCPKCLIPTEKIDGCNHITCRCGAHWCYACEPQAKEWFKTQGECYTHLRTVHGSYV